MSVERDELMDCYMVVDIVPCPSIRSDEMTIDVIPIYYFIIFFSVGLFVAPDNIMTFWNKSEASPIVILSSISSMVING